MEFCLHCTLTIVGIVCFIAVLQAVSGHLNIFYLSILTTSPKKKTRLPTLNARLLVAIPISIALLEGYSHTHRPGWIHLFLVWFASALVYIVWFWKDG